MEKDQREIKKGFRVLAKLNLNLTKALHLATVGISNILYEWRQRERAFNERLTFKSDPL